MAFNQKTQNEGVAAPGSLINEPDLVEALQTGSIAGAGLDVFVDEPNFPDELFKLKTVVLQPYSVNAAVQTPTRRAKSCWPDLPKDWLEKNRARPFRNPQTQPFDRAE